MTTKASFTDQEWARLERAPIVAGMAISLADPGGPIDAMKESLAAIQARAEAAVSDDCGELVEAVAMSVAERAQRGEPRLEDRTAFTGEQILEELRAVNALVTQKATREEAAGFREWLLAAAKQTAEAAKEGGFLGFRAERVSEGEQRMLDRLGEVLS